MAGTWEYKTVVNENAIGSYKSPDATLNALGMQEWELVGTNLWQSILSNSIYEIFYLKRAKP